MLSCVDEMFSITLGQGLQPHQSQRSAACKLTVVVYSCSCHPIFMKLSKYYHVAWITLCGSGQTFSAYVMAFQSCGCNFSFQLIFVKLSEYYHHLIMIRVY